MSEEEMGSCLDKQEKPVEVKEPKTSPKQKEAMKKNYRNNKTKNNSNFLKTFTEKMKEVGFEVDFTKIPLTYSDNKYKLLVMKKFAADLGIMVLDDSELKDIGESQ